MSLASDGSPMSHAAVNIQWFITNCCSCNTPEHDYPLPFFRARAGEVCDPGSTRTLLNEDIGYIHCAKCGQHLQGPRTSGVCFACAKKARLPTGLKEGASIRKTSKWRAKEKREGIFVYGPIIPTTAYVTAATTQTNEMRALSARQLAATPIVNESLYYEFKAWLVENRRDIFPGLTRETCAFGPDADVQFREWNSKFPKGTRTANERAWPLVKRDYLSARMLRKVSTVKLFLKLEKYDKAEIGRLDPSLAPRCISSWVAYVNVATFCLSLFHEYLVRVWGDSTRQGVGALRNVCFPAGMNGEDLSHYFTNLMSEFSGADAYEDDFTLYDSTQNRYTHETLELIYDWAGLNTWPNFQTIRRAQSGTCAGVTRHGIKYTDVDTMRSGSADTCLGNTIINYLYHMFAIAHNNRQDGKLPSFSYLHQRVAMLVLGDDNVTLLKDGLIAQGIQKTLNALGLISKLQKRDSPPDCVFLNQWFIHMGQGEYRCMPNFFRMFGKIGYACEEQPDPSAYVFEVARAFRAAFSCCTIPSRAITHLMEVSGSRGSPQNKGCNKKRCIVPPRTVATLTRWKNLALTGTEPTPESDADFARKCGFSNTEQQRTLLLTGLTSYRSVPCSLGSRAVGSLVARLT